MSTVNGNGNAVYYHYDHLGNTRLVTDEDGNVLNVIDYEAYGGAVGRNGASLNTDSLQNIPDLFVGAYGIRYDAKTDLSYMRMRWYSGDLMRFISKDLFMNLNRYSYVKGNPINYIDPSGTQDIWNNISNWTYDTVTGAYTIIMSPYWIMQEQQALSYAEDMTSEVT